MKSKSFIAIADESPLIRATVGIIITTIFNYDGPANWREILPNLVHFLDSPEYNMLEGSLGALQKMCEDSADRLNQQEINLLLPKVVSFFSSPHAKLRSLSVNTINCILLVQNDAIDSYLNEFLTHLFSLANDTDAVGRVLKT